MSTPWPTHRNIQLNQQLNKHLNIRFDTILIDTGICFTLACKVIDGGADRYILATASIIVFCFVFQFVLSGLVRISSY